MSRGSTIGALDLVVGAEARVGLGAGVDVLHLNLHERAAAAADVHVVAFEHPPDPLCPTPADCRRGSRSR